MNFFKKIGMTALFYALGFIINANANYIFASGGMSYIGYSIPSIVIMSVVLVTGGKMLRGERLKKNHKGDDSEEKVIFNGDLKGKYLYIFKTKEFKLECIISTVIGFIAILVPMFEYAYLVSFPVLFSNGSAVALIIFGLIAAPIYISALNALTWVMAYNKAYKKKAY